MAALDGHHGPGQPTLRRRLGDWADSALLPQVCQGACRWLVGRSNIWVLENNRLALRYDRLGFIVQSLLQAACTFLVAGRLAREL